MHHPIVSDCALRVAEAVRTSAECDARLADSQSGVLEQCSNSRDVVERSRALLKKLRERDGQ
jgi:hypothetical protein